ncbi:MAG: AAA family ATPase [Candidatus Micrarchaeota archaeon]|nr:AAA family ATPase [Candidatus Micrarchaeota archaeon]MDE1834155.1 AAA family ATPase [Candidatus Micrarchaeota archaeon]MDE1859007.1 AAA family ATPase [Candidatus Micrarchaeota archaeon]
MVRKHLTLVIVGLPGSGKSIVAEMLKHRGFEVIELGDIWRELLKKNNISRYEPIATREFTRKIREKYGKEVYAKYAYKKIEKNRNMVAIMGVRSTYEMNYFKKRIHNIHIIALLAPLQLRYSRLKHRGKPEDPKTLKSFKWLDQREKQGFMKARSEVRHGVMRLIDHADYIIANTATIQKLEQNLDKVIGSLKENKEK